MKKKTTLQTIVDKFFELNNQKDFAQWFELNCGNLKEDEQKELIEAHSEGIRSMAIDTTIWQTVNDRPEYYKLILCYGYTPLYSNKTMAVCWYASDGENDIYTIAGTDWIMKDVSHWMPLPSEPICT